MSSSRGCCHLLVFLHSFDLLGKHDASMFVLV